jgi:hypothetical protein
MLAVEANALRRARLIAKVIARRGKVRVASIEVARRRAASRIRGAVEFDEG